MTADQIARELEEAREAYYNSDSPILSDARFDELEEELKTLQPDHPYFTKVGTKTEGSKITHTIPMLSMGKAKIPDDVWKWVEKLKLSEKVAFIMEPKIDGLSATCLYRNGALIHVATRGDGSIGQDVSHIAPHIQDIPDEIHFALGDVEIRGELYLPKNTDYDTHGKPLRNNCVGLINRKEDRQDLHHVRFAAYQIVGPDPSVLPPTEEEKIKTLHKEQFHTVEIRTLTRKEELESLYREYLESLREKWLYETDGLIFMINDCSLHEEIDSRWIVDHHHHYAIALKPPAAFRETTLKTIEWQISRLGSLIPVAVFEPVQLGGATLERASLHNYQFVKELQLIPGDQLLIERANDVIPYVRGNLSSKEREMEGFFHPLVPRSCPVCQSEVEESGVHLKCSNPQCAEREVQSILYWVRMSGMEQIAEGTIRQLVKSGKVESIRDLYRLKEEDFMEQEGFGEKKTRNFLQQMNKTRSLTALEFISKLGIPLVQKKSLMKLKIFSMKDFLEFEDDSYVIGQNIIEWKEEPANRQLLEELLEVLNVEDSQEKESSKGEICMTGKGPMGRKELAGLLEKHGYTVSSSVTQGTTLLLTDNPDGNSSKLQKARKQETPIKSYEDFLSQLQ